jgi:myo-inositol 2-dehydrogenase / D-chiro-inositol 1-dehydrogenase
MYSIALFGAGRIGQLHASNIAAQPDVRLTHVVDVNAQAARELAERHSAVAVDEASVFENPEVDLIFIASATPTHADLIEKAVRARKAVFCEKPVDLSLSRVNDCLEVIEAERGRVFLGFNRRFDPNMAELKRALDAGEIGRLELLTIASRDPAAPPVAYLKESGGLFRDMTIHDFDMARWLLGQEPIRVQAMASSLVNPEIAAVGDIDTAVVSLQCPDGTTAVITNSRRAVYGYDQRVEAHGAEGMLAVENVPESTLVKANREGVIRQKPMFFFTERYSEAYRRELDAVVAMLRDGGAPVVSTVDGKRALELADAAYESLKTGRCIDC